jgi:acetate kinase
MDRLDNTITLNGLIISSVCAIDRGKSVDTSMGLSPLEGLIMGTRCGDVDATVGLRIAQIVAEQQNERHQENNNIEKHQISPLQRTESILNHDSGLKGICGISDMRELLTIKNSNPDILDVDGIQRKRRAQLAFEMFCYRVKKYIGAYFVALDGIDAIVFSAGIGENSAEVRDKICQGLECIGIRLSKELNEETESKCARKINAKDSRIAVLVVPTEEEAEIARIAKETAYKQQYISLF